MDDIIQKVYSIWSLIVDDINRVLGKLIPWIYTKE